MSLKITNKNDLKNLAYLIFIISFISLNLFLTLKFFINLHLAIFEEPSNILFWDDWSITDKNFVESILRKHNEHQLSIPIALSWISYKFSGLPGGFNLFFSSLFRLVSLAFYFLTIKKICKIKFLKDLNINGLTVTFLSIIIGTIFLNYPISFRTLDWGFMLHWYIPLSILFINGYLVFSNDINLKLFIKTYFLVFISYFSGSQWIICLCSLSILFFMKSFTNKLNLLINSIFSIFSLIIIDSIAGNSSTITLDKLLSFKYSFLVGIIWHAFNLSLPFILILLIIFIISSISDNNFKEILLDSYFQFSAYIFSAGIVFSIIVTIARGNNSDADIFSPSYPTYTGLLPLSFLTFILFQINEKTIFDNFGKIYFLVLSLFFTFSLSSKFYLQKISIIKQERYWQTYSFACRVIGYNFKKKGYAVIFDPSCGQTYPSDKKVFFNMENPVFINGFKQIIIDSNTSADKNYRLIKVPIIKFIPFIKKLKLKEINSDFPIKESYINIIREKDSGSPTNRIKISVENNKYM